MEPEAASIAAEPQVDGSHRITQMKIENRPSLLVPHRRGQPNLEGAVGLAVTEDPNGKSLLARRNLDLELRMFGGYERGDVEEELHVGGRDVRQVENEACSFVDRPHTCRLEH